uniref:Uncharacterized protein n=1 Tax=Arundo donax TaxID=35708 RepID=A0A0A9DK42_ARUDO
MNRYGNIDTPRSVDSRSTPTAAKPRSKLNVVHGGVNPPKNSEIKLMSVIHQAAGEPAADWMRWGTNRREKDLEISAHSGEKLFYRTKTINPPKQSRGL